MNSWGGRSCKNTVVLVMGKWMCYVGRFTVVVSMMGKGIVVFVVVVVDERIMLLWGFLFVFSAFFEGESILQTVSNRQEVKISNNDERGGFY